jgi:hypothetical protein
MLNQNFKDMLSVLSGAEVEYLSPNLLADRADNHE